MRVLAAVIIPPHMMVSGAVNAAKALSRALANHCSVYIAVMASQERDGRFGRARLMERRCQNCLGFTDRVLPNRYRTLLFRSDIPNLVRRGEYDLVHLHNPIPALEMKRVALACLEKRIPYVVSTHGFVEVTSGGTAYRLRNPALKLIWNTMIDRPVRFVTRNASCVFALSPVDASIVKKLGVSPDRVRVVTNGVEERFFDLVSETAMGQVLARYGLPALRSHPVSVYLGNHTANKGLPILLEAFRRLEDPFTLVVCGKKRSNFDYERWSRGLARGKRIVFTDFVCDKDVRALLHHSDLFVYPTLSDTFPLVTLEAMASGLPILSTEVGGIPFQVKAEFGRLVRPGDPEALADGYRELIREGRLREKGARAREHVRVNFRWDRSAELAFGEYRRLLEENGPPRP